MLPKTIDLGTVTIGAGVVEKELSIDSTCPVNFEYELREVKPHPDIRLVTAASGDIVGMSKTPVIF